MQNLQVFNNADFGEIRVLEQNGEPWFVGKDVAEILGYNNARDALKRHVDDEDKGVAKCDTPGGRQDLATINESGLYSLILFSKLPQAKPFKRWVTSEVLPMLRKTGKYEISREKDQEERLQIMAMNAKSRMAQTYLKLADVDTLSREYKNILVSKASEVLAGEQILPLPKSQKRCILQKKSVTCSEFQQIR